MSIGYRFIVRGRVQGVGFRQATAQQAQYLMLDGWVRNREDNTVEGEAWHEYADALAGFQRWLEHGPPSARVESVEWIELAPAASLGAGFSIRR